MARAQERHLFDAPIPGQSLTKARGTSVLESPPLYADASEAAEGIWGSVRNPKAALKLEALLEIGTPVEVLANNIVTAGVFNGKWNPDVAMLLKKPVMYMITAIGKEQGVKDFPILKPDNKTGAFLASIDEIKRDRGIDIRSFEEDRTGPLEVAPTFEERASISKGILAATGGVDAEEVIKSKKLKADPFAERTTLPEIAVDSADIEIGGIAEEGGEQITRGLSKEDQEALEFELEQEELRKKLNQANS